MCIRSPHRPFAIALYAVACVFAVASMAACGSGSSLPNDGEDTIDAASFFPDTVQLDTAGGGDAGPAGEDAGDDAAPFQDAADPGKDDAAASEDVSSEDAATDSVLGTDASDDDAGSHSADADAAADDEIVQPPEEIFVPEDAPAPGAVVITEIMNDPAQVLSDAAGEWVELTNVSAETVDLAACKLHDAHDDHFEFATIGAPVYIAPGGHVVVAVNGDPETNGGIDVAAVYSNFFLSNTADEVILTCGGLLVDQVAYDGDWPLAAGAALSLDGALDADAATNDSPASWCAAPNTYTVGNTGSPGEPNPACPEIDTEVDSCQLLALSKEAALVGEAIDVAALVFDADVTDLNPWVDVTEGFLAQGGFGPDGIDPGADPGAWEWLDAAGAAAWDDAEVPGFDRYEIALAAPAAGVYDIAFRFSLDDGATWTHCDLSGSEDGYAPEDAGHLQTVDNPCGPETCIEPEAAYCGGDDGQTALEPYGPGECVLDGLDPVCAYPEAALDCTVLAGTCDAGACLGQAGQPGPGEVMFTEIMQNPSGFSDTHAEWFELHNTLNVTVNIAGCIIGSNDADALHTITTETGALLLGPDDYLLFARSADTELNGGLEPDYIFSGISLGNGDDLLTLGCDDGLVDVASWDGGPVWPDPDGASMQLDPGATTPNDGASWCEGLDEYAPGNLGTPGAPNPPCPVPDPCEDVVCDAPPAAACVDNVATTWADIGTCAEGECSYALQGEDDCDLDGLTCVDGECLDIPDPCNPNPCATPPAAACDGDALQLYPAVGLCSDVDGGASCAYEPEPFPCDAYGGTCEAAACVGVASAPLAGQVVFTEMMVDPQSVGDDAGEWVELTNVSDVVVDLGGCLVRDKQDDSHVLATDGPFLVAPGGTVLLGGDPTPAINGGYAPSYTYGGAFNLSNDNDELELVCGAESIDVVAYDVAGWPFVPGVAMQLDPGSFDGAGNDDPAGWCTAWTPYGDGDLGTPGVANTACPTPNAVDFCRLQGPPSSSVTKGDVAVFAGRIAEAGMTDLTPAGDDHPWIHVQAGYGPAGSDPSIDDSGWSLFASEIDPDFNADSAGEPGVDQYITGFVADDVGLWDVAYRVSVDNGLTWTSCDLDTGVDGEDGSDNGYQSANSGELDVAASPCDPNPCLVAPPGVCEGDVLTASAVPGTCELDAGEAVCSFEEVVTDCAALGGACVEGACEGAALLPTPGDVLVTEIMLNPTAVGDEDGEWIELLNVTDTQLRLDGCALSDISGGDDHVITTAVPMLVPAGGLVVLGKSTDMAVNGGVAVDYAYGGSFDLSNDGDAVLLTCGGELIDGVDASLEGFALLPGASIQLDADAYDAAANDAGESWCPSYETYDGGLGTPGATNPACPAPNPVDWCRLQWPVDVVIPSGIPVDFFGHVFEAGITDVTAGANPHPLLLGEIGLGPWGTDPSVDASGWTTWAATPNVAWDDVAEPGNDEYVATVEAPAASAEPYAFAFRFSADGGLTWTWCDLDAGDGSDGSADGYQPDKAGSLLATTGPCDPNPCTDPPASTCADNTLMTWESPGACTETGPLETSCEYAPLVVDCALAGGTCEAGACVGVGVPPQQGEAIFTEVMIDSAAAVDTKGEWFELYNTASHKLDLAGCLVADDDNDDHLIDASVPLIVEPGEFLVLARNGDPSENGGVTADYVYSGITMANGADELILVCLEEVIDVVEIVPPSFPLGAGAASQLDPLAFDLDANDAAESWCLAKSPYGLGDLGTPGAENEPCQEPGPDPVPVDWCRLQWPESIEGFEGDEVDVFGQVWQSGVTDLTAGVDVSEAVLAEVGYGPADLDPSLDPTTWTWLPAAPNPAWDDAAWPGNDEYVATIALPAADSSPYRYAYRFSADAGQSWTLCDMLVEAVPGSDGSSDGFQLAAAGLMTVDVDPCVDALCDSPPDGTCDEGVHTSWSGPGVCSPVYDGGTETWEASCSYAQTVDDCAALLGTCDPAAGCDLPTPQTPTPGSLAFTEIMRNPSALPDDEGEWFELTALTDGVLYQLQGCVIESDNDEPWAINDSVLVAGGSSVVFARLLDPALNGGVPADVAWGDAFNLSNGDDALILTCGLDQVDAVAWSDDGFPTVPGKAMQLEPALYDTTANDDGTNWCPAFSWYGEAGDRGTPGATNPACPLPAAVDSCRWQWPEEIVEIEGTEVEVYGRVSLAGTTDLTPGTDVTELIVAQVGWGAHGTDPAALESGWQFFDSWANPAWDDTEIGAEIGTDEWMGTLIVPGGDAASPDPEYSVAWRFSADNGLTWSYCGLVDPTTVPPNELYPYPAMDAVPDPCATNPCTEQPLGTCDQGVLTGFEAIGECTVVGIEAQCTYAAAVVDCVSLGGTCEAGACEGVPQAPVPGDILFTEIMRNPDLVDDDFGEWVELVNLSDEILDLHGCILRDDDSDSHLINHVDGALLVQPGAYVVLGNHGDPTGNTGYVPDYVYSSVSMANTGDEVALVCGPDTVDHVAWGSTFAGGAGIAAQLDPDVLTLAEVPPAPEDNDSGSAWCDAPLPYGDGELGSPGEANPACGAAP